jgi:phosphatidylserine/phosphatidylglycerophosphate/cardiolipin synthase-like enzyme
MTGADAVSLRAYVGDGSVMLAFDLPEDQAEDLAGFAITRTTPSGKTEPLLNRLSFETPITAATTPEQRRWTPTDQAPIQKFRWTDFPPDVEKGTFTYEATAMRFKSADSTALEAGPSAEVRVEIMSDADSRFELGFTRGYLSSQAYADEFENAPVAPSTPTIDFSTAEYEARWRWLGFHARKLVFETLDELESDDSLSLDVFAYDLNEPDVITRFAAAGPRLRLFLDDSESHSRQGALELDAHAKLAASAGADHIKTGHFSRFSHDKILILRRAGTPIKVLSGSANFSVRGLYVQANNVFVFKDPDIAKLYGEVFDQVWADAHGFSASELAARWFDISSDPKTSVCFSPHHDAMTSLPRVADAIRAARSSVLFSVMELEGGGDVLAEIHKLPGRDLYSFGTTQSVSGDLAVTSPGHPAVAVPFAYLHDKVPAPFRAEISGGPGQVIHNKFVVLDFNDENPVVFAGSSNLAEGGEEENGDNLVCFADAGVAETYAVEAVRLIDHYRFRAVQRTATEDAPLTLKRTADEWVPPYYDKSDARYRERTLFTNGSD